MMLQNQYFDNKEKLLSDKTICQENRRLFKEFLEFEEYKLKRMNSLNKLDEGTIKTLSSYISKLRNVNTWFLNKPLEKITKEDIKKVYDKFEDGKILNIKGKPFKDKKSYYNKIFKSKLFQMIGKADLSREVMEFYNPNGNNEVRFIKEQDFRKIADFISNKNHKLLIWLAWDIGENVNSLLKLTKRDCIPTINEYTKGKEYHINLRKEILKRTRTARVEPTMYQETASLLDLVLPNLQEDDLLFPFLYRNAKKFLDSAVKKANVKVIPKNLPVTWKDLRSSMACDLLSKGWNTDEVNARLGHKPSSREIDKYVSFLAIDKKQPKKKMYDNSLSKLQAELEESKDRERLQSLRIEKLQKQMEMIIKSSGLEEEILDKANKIKRTHDGKQSIFKTRA